MTAGMVVAHKVWRGLVLQTTVIDGHIIQARARDVERGKVLRWKAR